jgi:uncharacterized protein
MASTLPHLLVDGANVLHAWAELRGLAKRDREAARSRLIQAMAAIHDLGSRRVTVVFDGSGSELRIDRPSGEASFSILRTPSGTTADDVIERLVAQGADPAACVVATADRGIGETVRAAGGAVIDPEELAAWAQRAEGEVARRVDRWRDEKRPRI